MVRRSPADLLIPLVHRCASSVVTYISIYRERDVYSERERERVD